MDASKQLLGACMWGDLERARRAIENGADVNVKQHTHDHWSALIWASKRNDGDLVILLIDAGCNIHQCDAQGRTALHITVFYGYGLHQWRKTNRKVLDALLNAGADPNMRDSQGNTAIHYARDVANYGVLIDAGADLRIRNKYGYNLYQYLKICEMLNETVMNLCKAWSPHKMLPRWTPTVFCKYTEECDGFRDAIFTLLLCFRRCRCLIAKEVGIQIVAYVAEMHRKEMWWPAWKNFEMEC